MTSKLDPLVLAFAVALTACSVYDVGLIGQGLEGSGDAGADSGGSGANGGTPITSGGTGPGGGIAGTSSNAGTNTGGVGGAGGEGGVGGEGDAGASTGEAGGAGASGGEAGGGEAGGGGEGGACGDESPGSDCCPDNPDKTAPGVCGCDLPDTDSDDDGTPDCADQCPDDGDKTQPGSCGCGTPENAACRTLRTALAHRYAFDGTGTAVEDLAGNADGIVVNTQLTGNGSVTLAGGTSDQYVNLPNGIISVLTNATFEAWVNLRGLGSFERLFDFGASNQAEGTQGSGRSYLFLDTGNKSGLVARVALSGSTLSEETRLTSASPLPFDTLTHVAVVVDDAGDRLRLFVNAAPRESVPLSRLYDGSTIEGQNPTVLNDVNNWLGRSQFTNDSELGGTIFEFRIYRAALSQSELSFSFSQGPDPLFFEE